MIICEKARLLHADLPKEIPAEAGSTNLKSELAYTVW